MTDSFVAKVKSGSNQSWVVTPQIINNDGKQHDDITVGIRDGIKPTVGDLVMVNLLKNNRDFSNINEFYQASRANGIIIGILMTSGNNYYLVGNYNFTGNMVNDGTLEVKKATTLDDVLTVKGNTRSFVTYAELNSALQLVQTWLNGHNHILTIAAAAGAGGTGTAAPPTPPISIDISASQTNNVKTGAG